MADLKPAEPLMSTEWLTVDGPRRFELYVEDDVLNALGKELIVGSFGPTILSETSVPQLMQAFAQVARDIDVALTWTGRPTAEEPLQRRLAVTLVSLRHRKGGSASMADPGRAQTNKSAYPISETGAPRAIALLAERGANPLVETSAGSTAVALTVDVLHPDGMVARQTTRGQDLEALAELALYEIETAEGRWPVRVLPQSARTEDPILVLVDLLYRDGHELAERGDLAEQVIAAVQKDFPSRPCLEVDRRVGADEMPWFVVTAGAELGPAVFSVTATPTRTTTDRTLTQALHKLIYSPGQRTPHATPRPSAI